MHCFALVALLAVASIATAQQCNNDSSTVLILGGGMAGVAAANRLNELGITDFVLLEAQDRLGGRIRSEELVPGVNVNVGANWMHGVDPANPGLHPLYALSTRCTPGGLEGHFSNLDNQVVYDENGFEATGLRENEFAAAQSGALSLPNDPDMSLRMALTTAGWTPMNANDQWVEWNNVDFSYAEPPERVSVASILESRVGVDFRASSLNTARDFLITDNRGTVFLVECLANEFTNNNIAGDSRIHLNTRVTLIERGDDCVCVTAQENGNTIQYCARYAIVTFSVGVLKAQMNTLFSPPLSAAKQTALGLLENGFYYVIWVAFQTRFWDSSVELIGYISTTRGYFPVIISDPNTPSRANYVHLHVSGEVAQAIAELTDDAIRTAIGDIFRDIYDAGAPDPIAIASMRWLQNDLFLGSYSSALPGGAGASAELARPEGRMYFAGEGTSESYPSTIHGALLTGIGVVDSVTGGGVAVAGNLSLVLLIAICIFLL